MYKKMVKLLAASLGTCLLLTSFGALGASAADFNLLQNPSFETDKSAEDSVFTPADWSVQNFGDTTFIGENDGMDGTKCIKINGPLTLGEKKPTISQTISGLKAGTSYVFTYGFRSTEDNLAYIGIGSGSTIYYQWRPKKTAGAWQQHAIAFTTPVSDFNAETEVTFTLRLNESLAEGQSISFDCLEVQEADGHICIGAAWAGLNYVNETDLTNGMVNIGVTQDMTTYIASNTLHFRVYSKDNKASLALVAIYKENTDGKQLVALKTMDVTTYGTETKWNTAKASTVPAHVAKMKMTDFPYSELQAGTYKAEVLVWQSLDTLCPLAEKAQFTFTK